MNKPTSALGAHPAHNAASLPWTWLSLALLAHTSWGAYPVLARYLQTVSQLPSMALLALGNLIALLIYAPFVLRQLDWGVLRSRALWGFALIVVLRAITNLLAARFTLAIYVQLITLMTPLLVALLSAGLFREPLPQRTWPAIGLSLLGALLLISGDFAGGLWLVDGPGHWLGLALACCSTLCLALYMLLVPRMVKAAVPAASVLLVQLVALTVVSAGLSLLLGEDWGRYAALAVPDWLVFLAFVILVLLGANLGQIAALHHLGAPLVSSTMAWRLVATLGLAAALLGEQLRSFWQLGGAVLVIGTLSAYLWHQTQRPARHGA